jgi:hypothetical protein
MMKDWFARDVFDSANVDEDEDQYLDVELAAAQKLGNLFKNSDKLTSFNYNLVLRSCEI